MAREEEELREVIDRYYDAFNKAINGDPEPERAFWSKLPDVTLMTAKGDRVIGLEAINRIKDDIAKQPLSGHMTPRDLKITVLGDFAYVTCMEHGEFSGAGETRSGDHRATHLFHREDGTWKLVLRHADVDPEITAIVRRLEAA